MWKLYDELIAQIPDDLHAKNVVSGNFWTVVESELGVGVAGTVRVMSRPPLGRFALNGAPLREVAKLAKSWNFVEASIGVAAINAYFNTPEIARQNGVLFEEGDSRRNDPYIAYRNFAKGKRVAGIGSHSGMAGSLINDVAEMISFGEEQGDYPMQAVEELLPQQDLVYLPCYSEVTKDLPRYLRLCQNGIAVICGPSVTMSPILFRHGAFDMAGFVVEDGEMAIEAACGTAVKKLFSSGKKAAYRRNEISELG